MVVLLLTVFAWQSAQPKLVPMTALLLMCAPCLLVAIGWPLATSLPWHEAQPSVAPQFAVPLKGQLIVLQVLLAPPAQVKLLPLPASSVAVPFRWFVLPALIEVPVVEVVLWQLPHTV